MRLGLLNNIQQGWRALSPRIKGVINILTVLVIFVGIPTSLYLYNTVYSATINLTFAPKSATATIGSQKAGSGDNKVKPGTYTVTIMKDGFTTYTETITVSEKQTVSISAVLESNDPSTANWYQEHTEDYSISQSIGDSAADAAVDYVTNDFPIANDLPIVGLYNSYRVDYGKSPTASGRYALYISYQTDAYKQEALNAIRDAGYDIAQYEVIYSKSAPTGRGVTIEGLTGFLEKGLTSDVVYNIQAVIEQKYENYRDTDNHSVVIDMVTHTRPSDGIDSYTSTFTIDGGYTSKITVTISDTLTEISINNETLYVK